MMILKNRLRDPTWAQELKGEFSKPYMKELEEFVSREYGSSKKIFPCEDKIFEALNLTPLPKVKAVILGQDPYHSPGLAHGLSFSVGEGMKHPPSLRNIFSELAACLEVQAPKSGDLTPWAKEGVLLLNSVLTVEEGQPGSHGGMGWETLTDKIIQVVGQRRQGVAYVLWGSYARKKTEFIDGKKNLIVESSHPSPLSSHRGFFGSKPFLRVNSYLEKQGFGAIDWTLDSPRG